jgi:lipopolysaccharide/colanic/teichoic acid biosynthesis glycosyltransferase
MTLPSISSAPTRPFQLAAKRVFDIVSAATMLVVLSPLFLLISLAIKLDSRGPILSHRIKHGYNNQTIQIFKFRCSNFIYPQTRIGRILARNGLDQLPMLINVLRGDMSIVGLRSYVAPPAPYLDERLIRVRHSALRSGLLGWAQIRKSRSQHEGLEMTRQIEDDLFYITNWSLLLDAKIILMTLFSRASY